ncbi:MAG: DNA polymerase III subunit alpha, partial [Pseudobdellovibrionaceae bacterium]
MMYVELECQTNYSFLQGASTSEEITQKAISIGMPGIALTDMNGVYGIPKAYWASKEFENFNLISGCKLQIEGLGLLTILAQNRKSYGLMCRILTEAHKDQKKAYALLKQSDFQKFSNETAFQGLFLLSRRNDLVSEEAVATLKKIAGKNFYLTLQRHFDGFDQKRIQENLRLCQKYDIQAVATNQVLYHDKNRKPLCDIVTCIKEAQTLFDIGYKVTQNAERYLKSPFEMKLLFRDLPEAISNTLFISEQCVFSPKELKYRYPSEWIPNHHTAQSYMEELCLDGAKKRYHNRIPEKVLSQIQSEFKLIRQLEFADYFLTIYDIVDFANKKGILCQGRGSAANSVVCYCLGITAIDPVQMNLLFERFISLERKEPPDIDVDFEHERREEVIQYIYQKYGRDRAAMVSAVVTYQRRSAFREVAKVFGIPVGTMSAKELIKDFSLHSKNSQIKNVEETILKFSEELSGYPRHLSIHSGGFTLSADPLTEIVPVEPASMEGRTIIQWDKYDLDYLGLLKIDVLALGMLTALHKTLKLVDLELYEIPHEDQKTYQMIQKADTVGTFQVESRAQMNMSGRLQPKTFYDLVVQVAIVRPGPIIGKMVHPYLKRRRGLEAATYPHKVLKNILGKTLGVPLFQEQLMKIAIELGDFTPGEADHLRRAIGAWRASGSIQKVADKLLSRMLAKGIPESYAQDILEHMKGFAHYGFPESHAASFALITYASCYLKCHYPAEFALGLMNSYPLGFYEPHTIIDDAKLHGVGILPIDLNLSEVDSTLEVINEKKSIRLGLKQIHGISEKEMTEIITLRPYHSFLDFISKINLRKNVLEKMAMGDVFLKFHMTQRQALWRVMSERIKEDPNQFSLFKGKDVFDSNQVDFKNLSLFEEVKNDYESTGVSAKAHPIQALRKIKKLPQMTSFDVKRSKPKTKIQVCGLLLVRQKPPTANGVCFSAIEDEHGILDLVIFKKEFEKYKDIFLHESFLIVTGIVERDGHSVSVMVKEIRSVWTNPN